MEQAWELPPVWGIQRAWAEQRAWAAALQVYSVPEKKAFFAGHLHQPMGSKTEQGKKLNREPGICLYSNASRSLPGISLRQDTSETHRSVDNGSKGILSRTVGVLSGSVTLPCPGNYPDEPTEDNAEQELITEAVGEAFRNIAMTAAGARGVGCFRKFGKHMIKADILVLAGTRQSKD